MRRAQQKIKRTENHAEKTFLAFMMTKCVQKWFLCRITAKKMASFYFCFESLLAARAVSREQHFLANSAPRKKLRISYGEPSSRESDPHFLQTPSNGQSRRKFPPLLPGFLGGLKFPNLYIAKVLLHACEGFDGHNESQSPPCTCHTLHISDTQK